MSYKTHKSGVLQDIYLIQTHFRLEGFTYYEQLMKRAYDELLVKHDLLDQAQSHLELLEKDVSQLKLRLETIRALYPSAPSDEELDIAINAAIQSTNRGK